MIGSKRTWFLAGMGAVMVIGVMQLRSVAEPIAGGAKPTLVAAAMQTPAAPSSKGEVIGLPDFSGLVATNGKAVVNVSVIEKAQQAPTSPFGGGGDDDDDPFNQFFRRYFSFSRQIKIASIIVAKRSSLAHHGVC